MTDISSLQQTVEAAQEAFDRTSEQHARSRKHLASLINIVEENLREKRVALAQSEAQRERMVREYGQLRHMLHALVMAVEVGPREGLAAVPAPAGAGVEAGSHMVPVPLDPVPLDPAANDAGPVGNGGNENGVTWNGGDENGVTRNGGDYSENLRAGLKRAINKKRARTAKDGKPKAPAPVPAPAD